MKDKEDKKNRIEYVNIQLNEDLIKEIDLDRISNNDEIEKNKKYLIEEVLENGNDFIAEIDKRDKKSFWNKIMDFIFK